MKVITAPTRRGRPALAKPAKDLGTPELIIRRRLAVGDADPALATTPLGIMLARDLIDLDMHQAGETYRRLYGSATGRARDCGLDPMGSGGDDEALARITEQFLGMTGRLKRLGASVLREIVNVAVFQERPVWLMFALHNPHKHVWRVVRHHQDYMNLTDGLKELAR